MLKPTNLLKALLAFILIFAVCIPAYSKDVSVRGYTRKDGTYVAPYKRTAPDSDTRNNYSTKGNVNPYTGKYGTKNPDSQDDYGNLAPSERDAPDNKVPTQYEVPLEKVESNYMIRPGVYSDTGVDPTVKDAPDETSKETP